PPSPTCKKGTSGAVTVNGTGAQAGLGVTYPSSTVAGITHDLTVFAADQFGNPVATPYTGTVHMSAANDAQAIVPDDYPFLAGENGTHTFTNGATFKTVAGGTKSITATDSANSFTGTQSGITVTPAAAFNLTVTG